MKLEDFLVKTYGYNPEVKDVMQTYVDQWRSWYEGNVKKFHNYYIYNGDKKVKQKRFTLNMAKEISEDWSDIIWSEECKISMANEKAQKSFDDLIEMLDLYFIINQAIEKSGALGTSALVVSAYDIKQNQDTMVLDTSEAKTRIDIVDVDNIYPLSWNNKEITECAFGSVEYVNGKKHVVLSVHKKQDNGNYVIKNHLFEDTNGMLKEITTDGKVFAEFDTKSDVKWFSVFKPTLTNNLFDNTPFGISHYANAIDNLKSVDIAFDTIQHEINNGKRRIFVRADMFNYDNGEQKLVFDPYDTSVYQLPTGATKEDLIQSEAEQFRTDSLINALNTELNMLGSKVGFGENHYHFDGTNLSTATAVVSSNSKLFRRKKKLEIGYESSIYDLVNAIAYVSSKFGKFKDIDTKDMVIQFDDSIVEDKEAESNRALREVNANLISAVEYRMRIFGETEEIAKQKIKAVKEEEQEDQEQNIDKLMNEQQEDENQQKEQLKDEKDKGKEKEKEKDENDSSI